MLSKASGTVRKLRTSHVYTSYIEQYKLPLKGAEKSFVYTCVHVEEYVVCIAIVAGRLVLSGDEYGGPGSLGVLLQGHVQPEQVLGILNRGCIYLCRWAHAYIILG